MTKPPYEVTETGWGEFEIVIKIYFNDANERPVSMGVVAEKIVHKIIPAGRWNICLYSVHFVTKSHFQIYLIHSCCLSLCVLYTII